MPAAPVSIVRRILSRRELDHVLLLVGMIALWQLAAARYPSYLLPSPLETLTALREVVVDDDLLSTLWFSLKAFFIGFGLALIVGVVLGLVMGSFPRIDKLIAPYLDALYVTPHIMLIPLFVIWFGLGLMSRVAYIFIAAYFPIVVNTLVGVRLARGELAEMAESFGAGQWAMLLKIYLPGSVPMMLAGIRLGVGRGLVAMVTSEMFLAIVGLGSLVVLYGNQLQTAKLIALATFVALFGIAATRAVGWLGQRMAPWSVEEKRE